MTDDSDIVGTTFDRHKIKRETGWTWSCRRPGDSHYAFRVTWVPFNLIITGDIGEIVITHYSFNDPWAAAAWVNGANFDYFMSKSNIAKQYDAEATAEFIVETAYQSLREDREDTEWFKKIIDHTSTYGEASEPETRKEACRELMNGDLTADAAYEITSDTEMILMRYPQRSQWHYRAMKLWASWVWEKEPAWHIAVRWCRRVKAEWQDLRRYPVIFSPVLYVQRDAKGRAVYFNGSQHWRWVRSSHGASYRSVYPLRAFGRDFSRFGLWRDGGSQWSDSVDDYISGWRRQGKHEFIDVRPEWRHEVVR